jgi:glycosyltransferase involved in cell wall biosynthesis
MDFRPAMGPMRGIGRYVRGLAAALARDGADVRLYGVFLRGNLPSRRRPPAGTTLVAWRIPARWMNWLGKAGILPADRVLGGCNVYHHTDYFFSAVSRKTPQVMTIHDVAFLVPSEATARDCREILGLAPDRVFVTPLGVDEEFFSLAPEAPSRPYLLAVGTLEPRKNFARLIRAHARSGVDLDLLVAGREGWLFDDVLDAARTARRTQLLGHVPEPELRRLLAGASALLYPSLLEGFGLPVLEAMAAGKPVLTSDREPLKGLVGDAAVLIDPTDEEAIAHGIRRVVEAPPNGGPARARRYTWQACAAATRRAYAAAMRLSSRS